MFRCELLIDNLPTYLLIYTVIYEVSGENRYNLEVHPEVIFFSETLHFRFRLLVS